MDASRDLTEDTAFDFIEMHEGRLYFRRLGAGPPILLLHGSGSSSHGVTAVARILSRSHTVICPDLPGFGETGPRPDGDYRVRTYSTTVARFLEAIDVPRCVVVGNSLGGNIAWNLALDQPGLLKALVLINATGYPDKQVPLGMRLMRNSLVGQLLRHGIPRWLVARNLRAAVGTGSTVVDDRLVDLTHKLWNRPGNAAAFVDVVATEQIDRSGEIPAITVPTLVLRSASIDGQLFANDIAGSTERIHPTGGHLLPQEDPAWVAGSISQFLGDTIDDDRDNS